MAAGTEGQVFPNRWHPFHRTDSCGKPVPSGQQLLLSRLRARTAGPGQQAGAPFFSQSPTIPGAEPCRCQKGEGLQCMKGREEGKRRCKRACVRVCVCWGEMETLGKNRPAFRVWLTPSPASYSAYAGSHDLSSSPSHAIVCLTRLNKRCYFKQGQSSICRRSFSFLLPFSRPPSPPFPLLQFPLPPHFPLHSGINPSNRMGGRRRGNEPALQ